MVHDGVSGMVVRGEGSDEYMLEDMEAISIFYDYTIVLL